MKTLASHSVVALCLFLPTALASCAVVETEVVAQEAGASTSAPTAAPGPARAGDALAEGNAHFEAGRFADAAEAYARVVAADDANGVAWFRLGYALHAVGRLEEAIAAHEKAATFPEGAPVALYNLGCAHALLGDVDAAFAALGRARDAGFAAVSTARSDSDLTALHGDGRWEPWLASFGDAGPAVQVRTRGEGVYRQLDFWVGEWEVRDKAGKLLGTNSITSDLHGYLIDEEWTSAGGVRGRSVNYVDRDAGTWKQVWVSADGSVLQMAGELRDGSLCFEGKHAYRNSGTVDYRMTLTPLEDGRVRQFIEESRDGGTTWTASFEGFYARRSGQ